MLPPPAAPAGKLARRLSFVALFFVVVANMVGTGIFTTSGFMIADLGRPSTMLLAWVVGGLLALAGALCYAELGVRFPAAGGEYVFLREAFGKRMGFVSGWVSLWVGFSAPIAAAALTFGHHAAAAFGWQGSAGLPTALAVAAVLALTAIHAGGPRAGIRIQILLTGAKITFMALFCVLGLALGRGDFAHFSLVAPGGEDFSPAAFARSLVFVTFAYTGWNAAAYLGGEARRPGRDLPAAIILGTVAVMAAYLALNVLFIFALPPAQMAGVQDVGYQAAVALFGPRVGSIFAMAIALLLLSTIGAMVLTGPRVYFAMAEDGMFFRALSVVHPRTQVPQRALFLQAGIAVAMVLTSTFGALLSYVGVVLSLSASFTVIGLMRIRRREARSGLPTAVPGYRTWLYPVTPLVFVLINLWIFVWSVRQNAAVVLAGGVTVAAGYAIATVLERRAPPSAGNRRNVPR